MEEFYYTLLLENFCDNGFIAGFEQRRIGYYIITLISHEVNTIQFGISETKIADYSLPIFYSDKYPQSPMVVPFNSGDCDLPFIAFNIFACLKKLLYPLFTLSLVKFHIKGGKIIFQNSHGKIDIIINYGKVNIRAEICGEIIKATIEIMKQFNYLNIFDKIYDIIISSQYMSYNFINKEGKDAKTLKEKEKEISPLIIQQTRSFSSLDSSSFSPYSPLNVPPLSAFIKR